MSARPSRWPVATALALALLPVAACSGGGSGPVDPPTLAFAPSGTPAAPDLVRLTDGGVVGNEVTVHVAIGGPSTSNEICSFNFGVLIGGTAGLLDYVAGSETAGPALRTGACTNPIALATAHGDGVSVTVVGFPSCPNSIGPGESAIVSLSFRVTGSGSATLSLGPTLGSAPVAWNCAVQVIPSVSFDTAPAAIFSP